MYSWPLFTKQERDEEFMGEMSLNYTAIIRAKSSGLLNCPKLLVSSIMTWLIVQNHGLLWNWICSQLHLISNNNNLILLEKVHRKQVKWCTWDFLSLIIWLFEPLHSLLWGWPVHCWMFLSIPALCSWLSAVSRAPPSKLTNSGISFVEWEPPS